MVVVNENREIQTSLQLILTARASKREQKVVANAQTATDSDRREPGVQNQLRVRGVDQSVQLTLPSYRGVSVGMSLGLGQLDLELQKPKAFSDACT